MFLGSSSSSSIAEQYTTRQRLALRMVARHTVCIVYCQGSKVISFHATALFISCDLQAVTQCMTRHCLRPLHVVHLPVIRWHVYLYRALLTRSISLFPSLSLSLSRRKSLNKTHLGALRPPSISVLLVIIHRSTSRASPQRNSRCLIKADHRERSRHPSPCSSTCLRGPVLSPTSSVDEHVLYILHPERAYVRNPLQSTLPPEHPTLVQWHCGRSFHSSARRTIRSGRNMFYGLTGSGRLLAAATHDAYVSFRPPDGPTDRRTAVGRLIVTTQACVSHVH